MKESYVKRKIHSNTEIARDIYELKIEIKEDDLFEDVLPGQFYMVRSWSLDPFLSRPLSISDVSSNKLTFLYETVGKGTNILSRLIPGDDLELLGPLGNGFDLDLNGKIGVVAGGIGLAPMIYLMKTLDNDMDFYGGFRNEVYCLEEIKKYVEEIYITTEDGSTGHKGFVTELLDPKKYDAIITCGPTSMMEKVVDICEEKGVKVYISMEGRMACGFGSCLGCTVETTSGLKRVCKDGPVISGEEVIFNG